MSLSKVTLIGYIGRDPESKHLQSGTEVANFSVAVTRKNSNKEDKTTWFRISCYGKLVDIVMNYLKKGDQVYVDGDLSIRDYTDKEGISKYSVEVNASNVRKLSTNSGTSDNEEKEEKTEYKGSTKTKTASAKASTPKSQSTPKDDEVYDDDIPF